MYRAFSLMLIIGIAVAANATAYQFPLWVGVDDNSGTQLVSGEIYIFNHGTSTLATIYSDKDETAASNPFDTNAYGRAEIYAKQGYYDVAIVDSDGTTIETFDGGFRVGPADDFTSITTTDGILFNGAVDDYSVEISATDGGLIIKNKTDALKEMIFSGDGNVLFADGKEVKADEFRARDGDGARFYDDGNNGLLIADGGAATFSHALTVTGALANSATLTSTGAAQFLSTVGVTGAVTLDSTLSIAGNVSVDGGSFVFNDSGADKDFRIEGDSDASLFCTDAGNDKIGMGTASPDDYARIHMYGGDSGNNLPAIDVQLLIEDDSICRMALNGSSSQIWMGDYTTSVGWQILASAADGFRISSAYAPHAYFKMTTTEAIFNDDSVDADFRVESDDNAYALFVDAGNDKVGIGTSSPGYSLEVNGTAYFSSTFSINGGAFTFNENGVDVDYRCETNNASHMLFIDGGNDVIGINNSSPDSNAVLDIASNGNSVNPDVIIQSYLSGFDSAILQFQYQAGESGVISFERAGAEVGYMSMNTAANGMFFVLGGSTEFQILPDSIIVNDSKTPSTSTDTGEPGQICWDANYIYICTAANYWERAAIAHW